MSFSFIRLLPGDPVDVLSGERTMSPSAAPSCFTSSASTGPIWEQYFDYVWRALHGDLGTSLSNRSPDHAANSCTLFPATVELSICAMIIAIVVGVLFGMLAAARRDTWIDQLTMGGALVGYSMPIFWWGLLLIIVFAAGLHWFPVQGRMDLAIYFKPTTGFMLIDSLLSGQKGAFLSAVQHLVLPSIVLATIPLAVIARQTRSAMLEVLGEDYVRTARAKGLTERRVTALHAFRNALIPVVTTIGLQVGTLHGGRRPHRNDLFLAGHRQMDDRRHRPPRLHRGAGRAAADRGRGHAGEPDRRCALRPHQSAHPGADDGRHLDRDRSDRHAPAASRGLSEFWLYFTRNRGAVVGLVVFVLLVLIAIFAPLDRPARSRRAVPRLSARCRRSGRTAAAGNSSSAPTRSAATCCRG